MEYPDLTILFLTANEVPLKWAEYQKAKLLEVVGNVPVITISRKPMDWGINLLDEEPKTISNIYRQMLRGAKVATTEYVAVVEDDTLYPSEHFTLFRPPLDTFAYNKNRIGIFTWGKPTYFYKDRNSNSTLLAPRQLLIDALEERYAKWPNGTPDKITGELGRKNIAEKLGVTHHKCVEYATEVSVLRIDHDFGIDTLSRSHRKGLGLARSYDVPHWGRAEDIIKHFL